MSLIRKSSIEFQHRYEADSATPDIENASEGWTLEQTAASGQAFAVNNGILSYSTTANAGLRNFQQKDPASAWPASIDPGTSWTAEIKARVTASGGKYPGMTVKMENGTRNVSLLISENGIFWRTTVLDTLATGLDNASEFHSYRIAYNAPLQFFHVWRDTLAVGVDIEKTARTGKKTLSVGDVDATSCSTAEIDYFRWSGEGAFAPIDGTSGIGDRLSASVRHFALGQNYPNPFNASTLISYHLDDRARVHIAVYDVLGRRITNLIHRTVESGHATVSWNGTGDDGRSVSSGVYFIVCRAGGRSAARKTLLIR